MDAFDEGPMAFANPWEHLRLWSDGPRNDTLVALLDRHASGARVLEVGCGAGLLSCIAARRGAVHVVGVEPTPLAEVARALVRDNALDDIVHIVQAPIADVPPEPVDLAFAELCNADPFAEGLLPAMAAARRWIAPGGRIAPRRLRVWVALAQTPAATEAARARTHLRTLAERWDLSLAALDATLAPSEPDRFFSTTLRPAGPPVLAWDLALGSDAPFDDVVELTATATGAVGGAIAWFEVELDDGLSLSNPPERPGHWGQIACGWAEARHLGDGGSVEIVCEVDGGELEIRARDRVR